MSKRRRSTADDDTVEATVDGQPPLFDFRRPPKLSRDHVRAIRFVQEQLARRITTVLAAELRLVPDVDTVELDQLTFDDFANHAEEHAYYSLFTCAPLPEIGIVYMPKVLTMALLDRMLGGGGGPAQPARPFSEIERSLCEGLVRALLREFAASIESIIEVDPEITGEESNLLLAPVMAPSDMCVTVPFKVHFGTGEGEITFAFPFSMLVPTLEQRAMIAGQGSRRGDREAAELAVADRLAAVDVDLSVRFQPVRVPARQIADLRVGDVIPLEQSIAEPLVAWVGGAAAYQVFPGRRNRRIAARVNAEINP